MGLIFSANVFSQTELDSIRIKPINRAVLIGIGKSTLVDTYLSPLEYSGTAFSLIYEQLGGSRFFKEKLLIQQRFQVEIATTDNPAETASEYYANIAYAISGFYPIVKISQLKLYGGGGWDFNLGGIYNMRNSNNPGSLKIGTNLHLSAMAIYNWHKFTFRWQANSPFLGVYFSPGYGQSYYEIFSLGNDDGTIITGTFGNQLALRNYFTIDYPIGNYTVRAGYLGNHYRTDINNIITKINSHQFMIGLAMESLNFGGKKIKQNKWIESVYY